MTYKQFFLYFILFFYLISCFYFNFRFFWAVAIVFIAWLTYFRVRGVLNKNDSVI